jgi:nicotinamidase-related amidase
MHEYRKTIAYGPLRTGMIDAAKATAVVAAGVGCAAEEPRTVSTSLVPPNPEMKLDLEHTALVVIDPRVDVLSPKGAAWAIHGAGATERKTVQNVARLFKAAKLAGITIAISLTSEDLGGPGCNFMPELEQYIDDGKTIICSPHKAYSPLPRVNDLGLRLRKRCIGQIILAGILVDLRIESHLRDFLEQGFEVAVVRDAVAGPKLPEGNGYLSTLINFRCIANALWTTEEAVKRLG